MKEYLDFAHLGAACEATCLVLDTSGSSDFTDLKPSRLAAIIEASQALIDVKRDHHPEDVVAIISFSSCATLCHPMSPVNDPQLLRSLQDLRAGGGTNIRAGLEGARGLFNGKSFGMPLQRFAQWATRVLQPPQTARSHTNSTECRRVILLSDGKHNIGGPPDAIADALKREGIVVDVIGVGGSPTADEFDEEQLKHIASKNADGSVRYCFIDDTKELVRKFQNLAHHLKVARD